MAKQKKLGNPFEIGVTHGPQIDQTAEKKILGYINSALKQGAKLESGGKKWGTTGYFIEPTVFSNVTDNMTIAQEEVTHTITIFILFKIQLFSFFL